MIPGIDVPGDRRNGGLIVAVHGYLAFMLPALILSEFFNAQIRSHPLNLMMNSEPTLLTTIIDNAFLVYAQRIKLSRDG